MNVKSLIGARIKELRVKANLTQAELSEIVSIDPKHQSCIENGRNFPSADLIEKYAKAFNVDCGEILNVRHMKDKKTLLKEITAVLKSANDNDINLIHRIVFDILK